MIENKSGNLKEILCAIADGYDVQYLDTTCGHKSWVTFHIEPEENILCDDWLNYRWRKKPNLFDILKRDSFEYWWEDSRPCGFCESQKELIRIVWDAALRSIK